MRNQWEHARVIPRESESPYFAAHRSLNYSFETHTHDFFELELIHSGSGEHILNGSTYSLRRGSMYLVTPTDVHRLQVAQPLQYSKIMFTEDFLAGPQLFELVNRCKGNQVQLSSTGLERMIPLFEQFSDESDHPDSDSMLYAQNMLTCILIAMRRQLSAKPEPDRTDSEIQSTLLYIQRHFREHISLDSAAAYAGLSSSYFCKRFTECVGMHFGEYCSTLRVRYARNLLLSGNLPITEICFLSGFGSFSNFSREFRKHYHETPAQMRKRFAESLSVSASVSPAPHGTPEG